MSDMTPEQRLIEVIELEKGLGFRNFIVCGAELDTVLTGLRSSLQLAEAAAFLARAALDLDGTGWVVLADEMRAMAKKLRGEK